MVRKNIARYNRIVLSLVAICLPNLSQAQWDSIAEFPAGPANVTNITAGPDGALWFIQNTTPTSSIGRIDTHGAYSMYPVSLSFCPAEFGLPLGVFSSITVGSDGALWFTGNGAIGRLTTTGQANYFTVPNSSCLGGITPGPDGALWFTDSNQSKIGRITTAGAITEFPAAPGSNPSGITTGSDGALWFTETTLSRIGRITTGGVITEHLIPYAVQPTAIASGSDGALWFTEGPNFNGIGRMTINGQVSEFEGLASGASGITAGPDGAIWFTEQAVNRVGRITSSGGVLEYPVPTVGAGPFGITAGGDGGVWFTEQSTGAIGRAAACGLGMTLSYQKDTLQLNFDLGTSVPADWFTWAVAVVPPGTAATVRLLRLVKTPPVRPPQVVTTKIDNFNSVGNVGVLSVLTAAGTGLLCGEWAVINTGIPGGASEEELRQAMRNSEVVSQLPLSPQQSPPKTP